MNKRIDRGWTNEAVRRIEADFNRSADTHLIRLDLPRFPGIALYLKDESVHPTGSLKHRLARSLILYGLCNQWIGPDSLLVDATSGSTAVSEAYFARLIGLRFVAVVPRGIKFAVDLVAPVPAEGARGYVCEVYDGHFVNPDLGTHPHPLTPVPEERGWGWCRRCTRRRTPTRPRRRR